MGDGDGLSIHISIHALREEGDSHVLHLAFWGNKISIHALREEGDNINSHYNVVLCNFYPRPPRGGRPALFVPLDSEMRFLSTPSARRATFPPSALQQHPGGISIHALREEGDANGNGCILAIHKISIHALREEGDHRKPLCGVLCIQFLSTPSARRATLQVHSVR